MTSAYRRSSAVVTRRAAVIERLRRALFSPPKLLAVGALTLAFAAGNAFAQEGASQFPSFTLEHNQTAELQSGRIYNFNNFTNNGGQVAVFGWSEGNFYGNFKNAAAQSSDDKINYGKLENFGVMNFYGDADSTINVSNGGSIYNYAYSLTDSETGEVYSYCGALNFHDSVFRNTRVLENQGDLNLNGSVIFLDNGIINNTQTGIVASTAESAILGHGELINDGFIINMPNGTLRVQGNFTISGNGEIINYGTLKFLDSYNQEEKTDVQNIAGQIFNAGEFLLYDGNRVIDGEVYNSGKFVAWGRQNDNTRQIFSGDVVSHGLWESYGNVEYQGNLAITDSDVALGTSEAYFIHTAKDGSDGRSTFSADSLLTIGASVGEAKVYANADCLNVDLQLHRGANLTYTNALKQGDEIGVDDKYYITLDENQVPTVLEWNAGTENILHAIESQNVISRSISGVSGSEILLTAVGREEVANTGANGYTVVFDTTDNPDASMKYEGRTQIFQAFAVFKGDVDYGTIGADSGSVFQVIGESYRLMSEENDKATYKVIGCGMVGFYRGEETTDPNAAPSISARQVQFYNGFDNDLNDDGTKYQFGEKDIVGGSRIWIDTTLYDEAGNVAHKDHKLGAINAETIIFGDKTQIWYEGVSANPADVQMTFELNAPTIAVGDTTLAAKDENYNGWIDATEDDADGVNEIERMFGKVLVDAEWKPSNAKAATGGTVTISAKNVGDYAAEQGMTAREQELAQKLDGARVQGGESSTRFYDALYNETEGGKVRQTIHNLSLLGYNMLNAQGHFGNPTSSFFGGASLSGEAKRGQSSETDWPSEPGAQPDPSAIARPTYNPNRSVWAAYTHTAVDGDDYDCGGVTIHGYKLRRDGIIGGIRRQADATTSAGLFFGLSMPEVQSRNALNAYGQIAGNGYGTVGSKMEMTDFQFAGHVEKVFADVWELALYAGGGAQSMDWERDADLTNGGYYKYEADGAGNTLTGTIYLSYRADLNDALTLRPTIGVDSEHSWLYGFQETATVEGQGGAGNVLLDPYTDMFAQAYDYKKTYYNRNTARVGLSLAYSDPRHGLIGLNGRVFYGVKLGGDDAPELSYYSENYRWEDMASHEMGDSSLTVGGGGFMHLNPLKTLTATGAVNAIWYDNAQTFNVTGGVSYRF